MANADKPKPPQPPPPRDPPLEERGTPVPQPSKPKQAATVRIRIFARNR